MKYDKTIFNKEVEYYTKKLKGKVEEKVTFIIVNTGNKKAFYSIAPMSRAIHNLDGDMHIIVTEKNNKNLEIVRDVWRVYDEYKRRLKTKKVKALSDFIKAVDKRTGKEVFEDIFRKPDIIVMSNKNGFHGTIDMDYKYKWHRLYRQKELLATTRQILVQGYALGKKDELAIGFALVPAEKKIELPLEDYLDSYSIAMAMADTAKRLHARVGLGASSDRHSLLAKAVRTAELLATLRGCELDKEVDEEVFKKYKVLSKLLRINRMTFPTAGFGIHGRGYYGKHFFGDIKIALIHF